MKHIILFLILSASIFAQTEPKISDTLDVITLEKFSVPNDRQIVLTNIKKSNIEAELLDKNFNKIRNIEEIRQNPTQNEIESKAKGGRGVMVQYVVFETIDEPGEYFVKINISYRDEKGNGNASAYYKVNVTYPTVNNEISLRENYFYSERETMSFATAEFSDLNGYSYKIIDSEKNVLFEGVGPIVHLEEVMNNINNIGKTITVIGNYHKKPFMYKYNGFDYQKSEWSFKLNKPNIEEFGDWKKANPTDKIFVSAWNKNAMRFLYTYTGSTPNGFVVVYPEIKNFKFAGEPENMFLQPKYSRAGNFLYVTFQLNEAFVTEMPDCSEQNVKINIEFITQFGEKVEREYVGTILK